MVRATEKVETPLEVNIDGPSTLLSGNVGSLWYNVSYQTKKFGDGYVDNKDLPRIFVLGQGKTVLRLSFEELVKLKMLFSEQKDLFTACLRDEREKTKSDEEF